MKRKDFLKNFLLSGISVSLAGNLPGFFPEDTMAEIEKLPFDGFRAVDAHAHPYKINSYPYFLNGRYRHLRTFPTVDLMKKAGLAASVFAAVGDRRKNDDVTKSSFNDTMDQLSKIKHLEEKKRLRLILNKNDLDFAGSKNKVFGAIMAVEGGDALEGNLQNISRFYDYGVRLITILHKHDNEIGFNQESESDGPLTLFGIRVIEKLNDTGIIIDVAHSARKTLKSISEVSRLPLLDSHTAPFPEGEDNTFPNRARSWEEMEWIAKTGGVICTMPIGYKLGKYDRTTLSSWAKEIVLMKSRLGIEHVGLGTDSEGLPQLVKGWDSVASLPALVNELIAGGLSKEDILAFSGGNFLRIARACWQG